jgi:hypothetical protein
MGNLPAYPAETDRCEPYYFYYNEIDSTTLAGRELQKSLTDFCDWAIV